MKEAGRKLGMKTIISGGKLIDPSQDLDGLFDVAIEDGVICDIFPSGKAGLKADNIIDARGLIVMPGIVDMHVHLRDPGYEYKEDIESGTLAAAAGGVTAVACMANTKPVNDNATVTEDILKKTKEILANYASVLLDFNYRIARDNFNRIIAFPDAYSTNFPFRQKTVV